MNLKPCPFCGKEVTFTSIPEIYGYVAPGIKIECKDCDIAFTEPTQKWEQGIGHYDITDYATKKLVNKWNTRHEIYPNTKCIMYFPNSLPSA